MNKETNELTIQRAPVNQALNQVRYPANPMQSYVANQPYFNRYPGKVVMPEINKRPLIILLPWLNSPKSNTVNRLFKFPAALRLFKAGKRLDREDQGQRKKIVSKLFKNQVAFPKVPSGTIPLSIMNNIPILKSHKGGKLVISRYNSFLLHKLFPFEQNKNKSITQPSLSKYRNTPLYIRLPKQNRFLPNSMHPVSREERLGSVTLPSVETNTARNQPKFFPGLQISNSSPYMNQNRIQSDSPADNAYRKDRKFPYQYTLNRFIYPERTKLWTNTSPYFKPKVNIINSKNFQITTHYTRLQNDASFRSPLSKALHIRPHHWEREQKFNSAGDKVVTEGELKEKDLFGDILPRDHIRHKPGGKKAKATKKKSPFSK